jgi:CRP-like cAMP-binding protein
MMGSTAAGPTPSGDRAGADFPFVEAWPEPRTFAPDPLREEIREVVRWRVRRRRGQTIYQEGEPATTFYRVEAGCVRLLLYASDGRRQIVGFCFPGDLFGFALDARDCTAEASTDLELTAYSAAAFVRSTRGNAGALMQVTQRCLGHYRAFAQHVLCIRSLPAAERIAACMETFSARLAADEAPCPLPLSQIELSDFLGLTPETTSREVRKLCAAGRLARSGRKLLLLPPRRPRPPAQSANRPAAAGTRPIF